MVSSFIEIAFDSEDDDSFLDFFVKYPSREMTLSPILITSSPSSAFLFLLFPIMLALTAEERCGTRGFVCSLERSKLFVDLVMFHRKKM